MCLCGFKRKEKLNQFEHNKFDRFKRKEAKVYAKFAKYLCELRKAKRLLKTN